MQSASSDTNDTNTKSSVHKRLVQVAALKRRHATILSGFAVEDEVRCQDSTTDDSGTVDQLLGDVATLNIVGGLHVGATESILEGLTGLCEDGDGTGRLGLGLEGRIVDETSAIRRFGDLPKRRRDGERASQEERHDCDDDVEVDGDEEKRWRAADGRL